MLKRTTLDWSGSGKDVPKAKVAGLAKCRHCGHGALLRHPATGEPCHKTCEEDATDRAALVLWLVGFAAAVHLTTIGAARA